MLEVAGGTALLGLLFVVVGLPSAALLRRPQDGWVALGVDALALGVVWVPTGVIAWAWLGWPGLVAVTGVFFATVARLVARPRLLPSLPSPRTLTHSTLALGVVWLMTLAVAARLRLREVEFLPWVGDMGAYVNWANELVRTGDLKATWPPLFPAYLSVSTFLFGPEHTTLGVPLLGMLLVLLVGRLVAQVTSHRVVTWAAGAAITLNVHAVWYSSFPSSESLNAPLLVLWFLLVHRLLVAKAEATALVGVAVGVVMFDLSMLRGSGALLLVPLVVATLVAALARSLRGYLRPLWRVLGSALVASALAYWYGISEIYRYFVRMQMGSVLPRRLYDALWQRGVFEPDWRHGLILLVALVGTALVGTWAVRRLAPADVGAPEGTRGSRTALFGVLLGTALVLAGVLGWQAASGSEVWQIVLRMGVALTLGAVVALVVLAFVGSAPTQLLALLAGGTAVVFALLHTARLGDARSHAFFIYWDRYFVSEFLPAVVILTFVGLAAVLARVRKPEGVRARWGPPLLVPVAATAVVALVAVPTLPALRLATGHTFMHGAYDLTMAIRELADEAQGPLLWSADEPSNVRGFFFPNSWMAFAVPLERSFGYSFKNVQRTGGTGDFEPDDVLRGELLRLVGACLGESVYTVLDVDTGMPGPPSGERWVDVPDGVSVEETGAAAGAMVLLGQPAGPGWYETRFAVTAWEVRVEGAAMQGVAPCWTLAGAAGNAGSAQVR